jgi:hypothetical protein
VAVSARAAFSTGLSVKNLLTLVFVLCLAVLLPVGTASAQATHGLISGTVVDTQGAAIPGVNMIVRNQLATVSQTTQTNDSGYFVFPAVLPGTHTVSAEKIGFQKLEQTDITIGRASSWRPDRPALGPWMRPLNRCRAEIGGNRENTHYT